MVVDFNIFFIIIFCLKLSMLVTFSSACLKQVPEKPKVYFIKEIRKKTLEPMYERNP